MSVNKRLLLFCCVVFFSVDAFARSCPDFLVNGVILARPSENFSASTLWQMYERHRSRTSPHALDVATGETGSAGILQAIARTMAVRTGLTEFLVNPVPFYVRVVVGNDANVPYSSMQAGVWTVNRKMLELAETDEELAAMVGRAFLDHSLGHSLQNTRIINSWWYRMLEEAEAYAQAFTDPILTHLALRQQEKHDAEIRVALPVLLHRSGYSPWAVLNVNKRYVEALVNDRSTDSYPEQQRIRRSMALQAQYLFDHWRNLPSNPAPSTMIINHLKEQLQFEHVEPVRQAN